MRSRTRRTSESRILSASCGSASSILKRVRRYSLIASKGVSATTDALRGAPSSSATSPKKSPGRTVPRRRLPCTTFASPDRTTNIVSPRSPSSTIVAPGGNDTTSVSSASRLRSALREPGEQRNDRERLGGLATRATEPLLRLTSPRRSRPPRPALKHHLREALAHRPKPTLRDGSERERASAVDRGGGGRDRWSPVRTAARVKCVDRIDDLAALLERTHRHPRRGVGRAPAGPRPVGGGLPRRAVPRPSDATSRAIPTS